MPSANAEESQPHSIATWRGRIWLRILGCDAAHRYMRRQPKTVGAPRHPHPRRSTDMLFVQNAWERQAPTLDAQRWRGGAAVREQRRPMAAQPNTAVPTGASGVKRQNRQGIDPVAGLGSAATSPATLQHCIQRPDMLSTVLAHWPAPPHGGSGKDNGLTSTKIAASLHSRIVAPFRTPVLTDPAC